MTPEYCLLWIDWWPLCMTKAEWANWTQALVAGIAVVAGAAYVLWGHQLERDRSDMASRAVEAQRIEGVVYLFDECSDSIASIANSLKRGERPAAADFALLNERRAPIRDLNVVTFEPILLRGYLVSAQSGITGAIEAIEGMYANFPDVSQTFGLDRNIEKVATAKDMLETWIEVVKQGIY